MRTIDIIAVPKRHVADPVGRALELDQAFKLAAAAKTRPSLRSTPQDLTQGALDIAGVGSGLGVPEGQTTMVLPVDPHAANVGGLLINALHMVPVLVTLSGISPESEQALVDKFDPMITLYGLSVEMASDVSDSELVMAAAQLKIRQEMRDQVRQVIGKGILTQEEEDEMTAALDQLDAQEAKQKQAQADRRATTRNRNLRHQADLSRKGDKVELLRTMIDMQEGVPVDEARKAAAVAALNTLVGDDNVAEDPGARRGPAL